MKEFQKKSLAMLFAMFMLGACSLDNTSAEDKAMDEALGELDVDTTGMDQWRATYSGSEDGVSYSSTYDYYFGTDTYVAVIYSKSTMGSYWSESTSAHSGDLEIIDTYTLNGSDDSTITDKEGYVVYALTATDGYYDYDTNYPDETNADDEVYIDYMLVKISGSTMSVIYGEYDADSEIFTLYDDALADAYVTKFSKK